MVTDAPKEHPLLKKINEQKSQSDFSISVYLWCIQVKKQASNTFTFCPSLRLICVLT